MYLGTDIASFCERTSPQKFNTFADLNTMPFGNCNAVTASGMFDVLEYNLYTCNEL